jgi:protein phosphatase
VPRFDDVEHAGVTDVGIRRSHNQDAFSVQKAPDVEYFKKVGHLFIVADGMGGHAVGEKASAKAVQDIPLTYAKHCHEGPVAALRRAFQEANAGIHAVGQSNPEFRGLGTTATILTLREEGAWIGHVGDSRAYRVRDGQIEQLTFDHSYAWEMARRLGVPPEDLADVKKNVIIRSLGPDVLVQVDVEGPHPLFPNDTFVLCSDGLSNLVSPEEIGTIINALPPKEAANFLMELANLRGGPDNITVIVVRVGGAEASTMAVAIKPASLLKARLEKLLRQWNARVPWPLMVLMLGFLFALGAVIFAINETGGAGVLVALAALSIIAGSIGLILHVRRQKREEENPPEEHPRPIIYREYPCPIQASLVEKVDSLAKNLMEQLGERSIDFDSASYERHAQQAAGYLRDHDLLIAFREQCRALHILAKTFNKNRPREEGGFRPKFETTGS